MEALKQMILEKGQVRNENVLAVDSFINHQLDIPLMDKMGREFWAYFKDRGVTKVLTIEASGIAVACFTARYFEVPVLFARKTPSLTLTAQEDKYFAEVHSFTKQVDNQVFVSKRYLSPEDTVLIVDDFLAHGQALLGLAEIVKQAGAKLAGAGIVIEKAFQKGGGLVREAGIEVHSLARIASMKDGKVEYV